MTRRIAADRPCDWSMLYAQAIHTMAAYSIPMIATIPRTCIQESPKNNAPNDSGITEAITLKIAATADAGMARDSTAATARRSEAPCAGHAG